MGIVITDGQETGINVEVFENRARTFSVQNSLINYISIEKGQVFDIATRFGGNASGVSTETSLFIQNIDLRFLVVDRIYIHGINTSVSSSSFFSLGFGRTLNSGAVNIFAINENNTRSLGIGSNINSGTVIALTGGFYSGTFIEALRCYEMQSGNFYFEMIPQNSDGIILGRGNSIEIQHTTSGGGNYLVGMRFALVEPGDMG